MDFTTLEFSCIASPQELISGFQALRQTRTEDSKPRRKGPYRSQGRLAICCATSGLFPVQNMSEHLLVQWGTLGPFHKKCHRLDPRSYKLVMRMESHPKTYFFLRSEIQAHALTYR
ncbi:hypothetical protein PoB_002588000 [Plakobranchus ocellatus]|uniref:Uncharacterized protein n=1 Tax=Plakobranchus ocellatus TaxID=259542 RepID=A0AAV3ZW27_9GAST|nr:hypothetical protein PoB_002588000 [Plakobranchus ocellatus]